MSEYQYYEWQTVDRLLTQSEQAAVEGLSSHIDVSASRAIVTYNWSDFKHKPREVLLKYFDAHFYLANWGSLRLMFRFPQGLVDETEIEPYLLDEYISLQTAGQYQVLDLYFNPEDGGWMDIEYGASLSDFIGSHTELLEGDYRLLYLAWLKAETLYGIPDFGEDNDPDSLEYGHAPPIPPGLRKLSPSLQNFVHFFDIDPFLVQAAAETSPDLKDATPVNYRELVSHLPRQEVDEFLARLAEGESGIAMTLRKRLAAFSPPKERKEAPQPRTIQQLIRRAEQLKKAEKDRQVEAARLKHIAEMKALAARETQAWKQVEDLLDNGRKIAAVYDEATGLLEKLNQLSEFQDTRNLFTQRIHRLAQKYKSRPALMDRWENRGWI